MKPVYHISILLSAILALASCSSDAPSLPVDEGIATRIDIEATLGDDIKSRTPEISKFSQGMGFGLFVYKNGTLDDPFADNTVNINVVRNAYAENSGKQLWEFRYRGFNFDQLILVRNPKYNYTADFYAYYPYDARVQGLSSIKFHAATDIMYAVQNSSPTINKGIEIDGTPQIIDLHFERLMARFMFHFRFAGGKDVNSSQTLQLIRFHENNENAQVYAYVIFNALTGEITRLPADRGILSKECRTVINTYVGDTDSDGNDLYNKIVVCMPPTYPGLDGVADNDPVYEISFNLGNVDVYRLIVTKAMLRHDDGTYGLRAGYTYHFYLTMENYLHIDKVFVDRDWITEPEEIKIKI